jgi:hypothetical protein
MAAKQLAAATANRSSAEVQYGDIARFLHFNLKTPPRAKFMLGI